jgi:hypothetical protein
MSTRDTSVARTDAGSLEAAAAAFCLEHPAYADTAVLDAVRRRDFARLDRGGHVYLDYTGGGLYADSQLREHLRLLETGVYGNPPRGQPNLGGEHRARRSRPRLRARVLQGFAR